MDKNKGKNMILLFSGGKDSALIAIEHIKKIDCLLHFEYEHPAKEQERNACINIYKLLLSYNPKIELKIISIDICAENLSIGEGKAGARVVPCRNAIMLSIASNYAHTKGYTEILYGANHVDQEDYFDCTPNFFNALSVLLDIKITAPLLSRGKEYTKDLMNSPMFQEISNNTWSCYEPIDGKECGQCNSCLQ
tara:strand:+ start:2787 stop:3365 length:579 start_codon:yes stop_codon:yes gene_type:complete